jgi:hypothetical protein
MIHCVNNLKVFYCKLFRYVSVLMRLYPMPVDLGFMVVVMAQGQDFFRALWFHTVSVFLPVHRTHISFICHRNCIILAMESVVKQDFATKV